MIGKYDQKRLASADIIVGFDQATGAEVWIQDDARLAQPGKGRKTADIYRVPVSGDNAGPELLALVRQVKGPGYSIHGET
jgi:hypothetical protein